MLGRRLSAQLLSGAPARSVPEVVGRLLAVQAQDLRGARLAVRARSAGLTAADVDHELTTERSLVVTWLCRGTLHLVRTEDYWWLQQLTTPQLATGSSRRLAQEGVPPDAADRGVAAVQRALAVHGPLTRAELREHVAAAGVRVEGQALVHVLFLAALRGLTVRGPVVRGEQAFVLVRDWLGTAPPALDRDLALVRLARRFLLGHGPATDRDLARWANLPLRDVRRGMTGLAGELEGVEGSPPRLTDLAGQDRGRALPGPRLLGAFDPLLHGWVDRSPVLGDVDRGIVTSNGVFRPFALVEGRAVATWGLPGGAVALRPFAPITGDQAVALQAEASDVVRFLGLAPA